MKSSMNRAKSLLSIFLSLAIFISFFSPAMSSTADTTTSDGIAVDDINFPDDTFRQAVSLYDYDNNGFLNETEINAITSLYVSGAQSIQGVEYLTELTNLYCPGCRITETDLASISKLSYLDCSDCGLSSLDLSNNSELEALYCGDNQLTELNLTNNSKLKYLTCYYNQLTELDLTNNTSLTHLTCSDNLLTELDLHNNTELISLYCANNQLSELDISNNTKLTELNCYNNQLIGLDVSLNNSLTELQCYSNNISNLNLTNNSKLTKLLCENNSLTELDVSKNPDLSWLVCKNNLLNELDLSKNDKLNYLDCSYNQLNELDVLYNPLLSYLDCSNNQLSEIDVSQNTTLWHLLCYGNSINSINVYSAPGPKYGYEQNQTIYGADAQVEPGAYIYLWIDYGTQIVTTAPDYFTVSFDSKGGTAIDEQSVASGSKAKEPAEPTKNGLVFEGWYTDSSCTTAYDFHSKVTEDFTLYAKWNEKPDNNCIHNIVIDEAVEPGEATSGLTEGSHCSICGEVIVAQEIVPPTGIEINDINFPDSVFRNYVLKNCDTNKNGYLSIYETNRIKRIELYEAKISSMKGIEYFTNLEYLDCSVNDLTELDVSNCLNLKTLICSGNQINQLSVTNNTKLTKLDCSGNCLSEINTSECLELEFFDCSANPVTELNLSNNIYLDTLGCYGTSISSLDVSQNVNLTFLACNYNDLTVLDVSNNEKLSILDCHNNELTELDISNNTELKQLCCYNNNISSIVISSSESLMNSYASGSITYGENLNLYNIGKIWVDKETKIITDPVTVTFCVNGIGNAPIAQIINNGDKASEPISPVAYGFEFKGWYLEPSLITEFDFDNPITIDTILYAKWDSLITIDENNFPDEVFKNYVSVNFDKNHDGFLSAAELGAAKRIDLYDSNVEDLSGLEYFTSLEYLVCSYNNLTELDVTNNPNLINLLCSNNSIKKLDLTNNPLLIQLECNNNEIESLDLSNNTNLTFLYCGDNDLDTLDVSNNYSLVVLECCSNSISAIDVSNHTDLVSLLCNYNQLTELDVSNCTSLKNLECFNNDLVELDIKTNNKLENLYCQNNDICVLDISSSSILVYLLNNYMPTSMFGNGTYTHSGKGEYGGFYYLVYDSDIKSVLTDPITVTYCTNGHGNEPMPLVINKGITVSELPLLVEQGFRFDGWYIDEDLVVPFDTNTPLSENITLYAKWTELIEINETNFPGDGLRNYILNFKDTDKDGYLSPEEISQVTSLGVNTDSVKGIEYFTELTYLSCSGSQLYEVDVSQNTKLVNLSVCNSPITELDISKNTNLVILTCDYNELENLDVTNNTKLKNISCVDNNLTELDLSYNAELTELWCQGNSLTELDVSKNQKLIHLECSYNLLTELDLSSNPELVYLNCTNNSLTNLDLSNNPLVFNLWIANNNISVIDFSSSNRLLDYYNNGNIWFGPDKKGNPYIWVDNDTLIICSPFNVSFINNGHGDNPSDQIVKYGFTASEPDTLTEPGWNFDGWYTDSACTTPFDFSTEITEDIALYAKWTPITYTIIFNSNGHGTAPATQTVTYGNKVTKPSDPTDSGYKFGGWYTDSACTTAYDFNTAVTANVTLYAKWTVVSTPTPAPSPAVTPAPAATPTPIPTPEPTPTPTPEPESSAEFLVDGGKAHVQDIGDTPVSVDPATGILTIGTTGMGKRLEEITINFENTTGLSGTLEYRVHVQDIGWMDWTEAGNPAGTEGMGKRIEAIELRLTGELAEYYSVEYCVHIQDYGDMQGWVKDGALAGTTGESKRIEEIKIRIVPRGSGEPMSVKYRVHVQDYGWEKSYASNGTMSGTSGESKRLEGIEIFLSGTQYSGGIKFKTHVQDYGWQGWSYDGEMSGTQGESKRLEGICIELYGEVAEYYDIYYRVHAQDIGWMGWAKNGECAGTAGRSARLEGIQIVLVPKGSPAPGATYEGITAVTEQAFVEGF